MDDKEIVMMKDSFERIIAFFAALYQWLMAIFGVKPLIAIEESKLVKQSDKQSNKYGDKYKKDFLRTYQEDVDVDWNSNIDAIIRDPAKLSEALTDASNEYEKKWRSRILIENTPRGNVIMFYDLYKRGFSYYCDSAVMPYDIMNAIAMKYVVIFRCRDFFVDSQIVPKMEDTKSEEPADTKVPFSKQPAKLNLDKQAFAKLKSYNNATKKAGVSKENDKVINCFLHLGASRNWMPITKKVKANPINGFKTDMVPGATNNNKMSYLEYKRLQNK